MGTCALRGFVWGRAVADVLLARRRGRRAPPSRCASRRVHCVPVLLQQRYAGTQPTTAALYAVYLQSAHLTLACARVSVSQPPKRRARCTRLVRSCACAHYCGFPGCVSAVNTRSHVCTLFQNCAGDFRRMAPAGMAISVSSPTARPTFVPPLDTPSTKPLAARRFGPKEAARTATGAGSCMTSMLPSPRCPAPWRLSLAPRRCRCSITATCRCPSHRTCTLASSPSSTPLADLAAVPLSRRIVLSRCLPATTQTADRPGQIKATAAAAALVVARELM